MAVRTIVSLGDSFTEGLEDDLGPDGRHLGWADRVAAGMAVREGGLRYANLAVRGRPSTSSWLKWCRPLETTA